MERPAKNNTTTTGADPAVTCTEHDKRGSPRRTTSGTWRISTAQYGQGRKQATRSSCGTSILSRPRRHLVVFNRVRTHPPPTQGRPRLSELEETDVIGGFSEAATAHHQAILADEAAMNIADTAILQETMAANKQTRTHKTDTVRSSNGDENAAICPHTHSGSVNRRRGPKKTRKNEHTIGGSPCRNCGGVSTRRLRGPCYQSTLTAAERRKT